MLNYGDVLFIKKMLLNYHEDSYSCHMEILKTGTVSIADLIIFFIRSINI